MNLITLFVTMAVTMTPSGTIVGKPVIISQNSTADAVKVADIDVRTRPDDLLIGAGADLAQNNDSFTETEGPRLTKSIKSAIKGADTTSKKAKLMVTHMKAEARAGRFVLPTENEALLRDFALKQVSKVEAAIEADERADESTFLPIR